MGVTSESASDNPASEPMEIVDWANIDSAVAVMDHVAPTEVTAAAPNTVAVAVAHVGAPPPPFIATNTGSGSSCGAVANVVIPWATPTPLLVSHYHRPCTVAVAVAHAHAHAWIPTATVLAPADAAVTPIFAAWNVQPGIPLLFGDCKSNSQCKSKGKSQSIGISMCSRSGCINPVGRKEKGQGMAKNVTNTASMIRSRSTCGVVV
jgi:hypothetical protein